MHLLQEFHGSTDGCHLYGGWFYLVGEMVTAGDRNFNAPDSHHFDYWFGSIGLVRPYFEADRG